MSYRATVFNVMIASPGDVAAERAAVREVVNEWNVVNAERRRTVLLSVGWETHSAPAMGKKPQEVINEQILGRCDLLVGIFWTRVGTETDEYASGTVEEIERHVAAGKPTMLYFSSAPVHPDSIDAKQYDRLKKFRESCQSRGLYETFDSLGAFREKFSRQLQLKLNDDNYFAAAESVADALPVQLPQAPNLSKEAQTLLKEASQDPAGDIMRLSYLGGAAIQTHGKNFVEEGSPRSLAIWDGAIEELEEHGLVEAYNYKREGFRVTRRGYEVADTITL